MKRLLAAEVFGLALLTLSSSGCDRTDEATSPPVPVADTTMPELFPSAALRLAGPAELVLAEGDHGIMVTLAEYNASAEDYHFPADLDTNQARHQLLEKVVEHKVIAAEGRLRGYSASQAQSIREEERELVQQVVQRNMMLANMIAEEEARRFVAEHPERFPEIAVEALTDPSALMHVRFVMRDVEFRSEIATWRSREGVVVHRDRFEDLQRGGHNHRP